MDGSGHSQSHVCPLPSPQRDKEVLWVMRGAGEDKPGLFIVFYPMKKEIQVGKGENGKSESSTKTTALSPDASSDMYREGVG